MDITLKVIAVVIFLLGVFVVYAAKFFVKRYNLAAKEVVKYAEELKEKELELMKMTGAVLKVKIIGTFIALPGAVLIFILFR